MYLVTRSIGSWTLETKKGKFPVKKFLTGAAVIAATGCALAISAPAAQAKPYNYGAIALSTSTGLIGYSYDYPDSSSAQARAVRSCGARDCETVVWFANGCGAVAYSNRTGNYSWAYAASRRSAQSKALSYNNSDAYVVHWNCTSNHG
ncbi:DUF4189 domain-containing protein [Nocardia brasiliensis]|uniref:DUF4189 domain-containing protein n=1 Tax=Nocardia brasiliensis TaxID=37326 RepID=A0A6G9XW74_NOCBR|nr:DUF4189 domain-containing protein [Nocardia brasiliensis]